MSSADRPDSEESGVRPAQPGPGEAVRLAALGAEITRRPWAHRSAPASAEPIRVLLVDDHAIVRAGVRAMLAAAAPDVVVVGEATGGFEAVKLATRLAPDVVVMDLEMPDGDGETATRELLRLGKPPRVLILTMHEERERLLPLVDAGAAGYLAKDATRSDLVDAIRVVASGEAYVRPSVARQLTSREGVRQARDGRGSARQSYDLLSAREQAVLRLTADGLNGPEIAARLGISSKTVNTYKSRIQAKLGLENRAAYVRFALEAHILDV
ncbi:MAG TPA: response regulator transcription factor [Gemmatimonadaceae bacterium]|nr:response regulator transcription factor [Gemmatimonadaceae bacterium]